MKGIGVYIYIAAMSSFITFVVTEQVMKPPVDWDYMIDLDHDCIEIVTDHGAHYIIHPDSLQQFINNDNL